MLYIDAVLFSPSALHVVVLPVVVYIGTSFQMCVPVCVCLFVYAWCVCLVCMPGVCAWCVCLVCMPGVCAWCVCVCLVCVPEVCVCGHLWRVC